MHQETQDTERKRNWRDEFLKTLCGFANAQGGTLLSGSELNSFFLRRTGKTWDGVTVPKASVADLDAAAFQKFRAKALASGRLDKADLELDNESLLDNLQLIEDGELTRAAVLLFHQNPERLVFGAFVKVGYFETGADLIFEDRFYGPLISMPDEIVDTIFHKYFKGIISYQGLLRITDYPVPRSALREAILNAIVHRDYTTGIPIQIKVFPDSVTIYNDGKLPDNWTVHDLLVKHKSRPYNPKIANTFFRAGYIEEWGRGIERIAIACKAAGKREPLFEASTSEISVTFFTETISAVTGQTEQAYGQTEQATEQAYGQAEQATEQAFGQAEQATEQATGYEKRTKELVEFCTTARSRDEMMVFLGISSRPHFHSTYLKPLLQSGKLKMTMPDKPNNPSQKYIKS